jgi:16S rRNA (guanine(966)-N(2))-methyltransferase RsmD
VASLRIIGGTARGRRIQGPREPGLRPTADRVRQVIFDILGQRFDGGEVLDLYAGTGALALEALSRGATRARLVDRSPEALDLSQENATTLGFGDRVFTSKRELPAGLAKLDLRPVDLLFADPPYDAQTACNEVLHWLAASGILSPGGVAVLEHSRRVTLDAKIAGPHPLQQADQRLFGDTAVSFYAREN